MVEVFCSVLSGASIAKEIGSLFRDPEQPQSLGHFFGAMDISAFMPLDLFRSRMDWLVESLKSTPLEEGVKEILVPGEPEARKAAQYRAEGIPLAEDVIDTLNETGASLGVSPLALLD